jgi:hypothetical protein
LAVRGRDTRGGLSSFETTLLVFGNLDEAAKCSVSIICGCTGFTEMAVCTPNAE